MRWITLLLLPFAPFFPQEADNQLHVSINVEDGTHLKLSDGSSYEIAPDDRFYAAYWVTPAPITLGKSGDPDYPVKLTNTQTGTSVRGKPIDTKEMIQSEREKRLEREKADPRLRPSPQPKTPEGQPPQSQPIPQKQQGAKSQ